MEYIYPVTTLLPLATYSTSGGNGTYTGPVTTLTHDISAAIFQLTVTSVSSSAATTLDVYVQQAISDPSSSGPFFDDFIHFTQVAGGSSLGTQIVAPWIRDSGPSSSSVNAAAMHALSTAVLAAGSVRQGPIGTNLRCQVVTAGQSSSAVPFKCAVSMQASH